MENITKTRLFKYIENFTTKNENFQMKILFFKFLLKNIDCRYLLEPPRQGGFNEYPQSLFLSRNKKDNVYPCKPQFYYIKVGFKRESTLYRLVFVMGNKFSNFFFFFFFFFFLVSQEPYRCLENIEFISH